MVSFIGALRQTRHHNQRRRVTETTQIFTVIYTKRETGNRKREGIENEAQIWLKEIV